MPVEAKSKQEAYNKVKEVLESGDSIHASYDYECDLVEIIEHIDSDCKYSIDDYDSIKDVEEVDERIKCELSLTAFDIARYGQDELYRMVEEKFMKVGLDLDIQEMDLIPIKFEEHFVTYDAIPTKFKRN